MHDSISLKSYSATLLLGLFLGLFGAHRFYVGKTVTGLIYLFSAGLLGIGWVIDVLVIAFANFTDKGGRFIRPKKRSESSPGGEEGQAERKLPVWVWIIIAIFGIGAIGSLFGGDESESESPQSETSEEVVAEEEPEKSEPAPEPEPEPAEDVVYTGSGDSVLSIDLPAGPDSIGVATISHSGESNFVVWSLDQNLNQSDLLINEIGAYSGTVVFNLSSSEVITALEISANGAWEVILKDALTLPQIQPGGTASGTGDDVLVYFGDTTVAAISHSGESNFAVWSYGNSSDLLINEIGNYSGQVRWPGGPALVEISADGDWNIDLD